MASFHHYPDTGPQMRTVDQPVRTGFENDPPGIATLGDVVRRIGGCQACETGHDK